MGDYAYGTDDQQTKFWISGAQITKGRIFRAIRKNGKPWGTGWTPALRGPGRT
jgi:hypothetical protein